MSEGMQLVVPQRFYAHQQAKKGDRHLHAARARFIPSPVVSHFQLTRWPMAERGSEPGMHPTVAAVDLGGRLRDTSRSTGA
jgi:DNA helicase-2/ATP-dependent DNA helicase PcrA